MKKLFAFILLVLLGLSAQVNASVSWRYNSGVYGSFEALDGVCYYDIELQNNDQYNSVYLEFVTYYDGNQVDYFGGSLGPYSYTPVPFSWNNIPEGQHSIGVDIYVNGSFWDYFSFTRTWYGTPNVFLDQLFISPNQTAAGNPFDLVTTIQNTGNGAENVVLDVYLQYNNEPEFLTGSFPFTAWPNRLLASPPKTATLQYSNGAFPAGNYSWRAELQGHNSLVLSKTFSGTTDLEFGTVSSSPANPVALQAFDLSVDLYNYGTAIAEDVTVEVYDGSTQIGSFYLSTVDPRYYYPLTFSIPENYLLAGSHSFWFKIAGQSISSAPLNLNTSGNPSLYFEPCTMTPSSPMAFQEFELTAPLINAGGATAEDVVVDLLYDGTAIVEYNPTDILPLHGINYTITVPSTFVSPGVHTFTFEERGSSPLNQVSVTHSYANNGTPSLIFPSGITFDPVDISEPFTSFTTETVVENNGTGWADDVIVLLKVNGTTYGQYGSAANPIVLYPTGSIHLLPFAFTAAPGTYDFSYEVLSAYAGADGRSVVATKTFSITIPKPNPFACGSVFPETIDVAWGCSTGLPSEMQESHYSLYYSGTESGVLELEPDSNTGITLPFNPGTYDFSLTATYTYGNASYESEAAGPLNIIVEPEVVLPTPNPPTGLTVTNPQTGDRLDLQWDTPASPLYHWILRKESGIPSWGDFDWSMLLTPSEGTTYRNLGLEEGHTYHYVVYAMSEAVNGIHVRSDASTSASGTPSDTLAPEPPVADTLVSGPNSASISWLRPEYNVDGSDLTDLAGYRIEYQESDGGMQIPPTDGGDWLDIGFNGTAVSTIHSFSASGGKTLTYRIFALDDSGNESAPASLGSFSVPISDLPPQPPTNLKVKERLSDSPVLDIIWNPPSDNDIASYQIYRKEGDTGTFSLIADQVTSLQFTDRSVQFGIVYTYFAVAVDLSGQSSAESNHDSNSPAQKLLQILSPLTAEPAEIHPHEGDVAQIEWQIAKSAVEQYPEGLVKLTIISKETGESVYKDFEQFPSPEQVLGIRAFNWDGYVNKDTLAPAGEYDCKLTLLDDAPGIQTIFETEESRNILLDQIPVKLTPDYDRNGVIDGEDTALADASEPYRVWFNLDNDDPASEVSGDDFPTCPTRENVDFLSPTVDGIRDLIDFFPIRIQIDERLRDTSKYSYKLDDPVGFTRFNFAYSGISANNANAHHTDVTVASSLATVPTHRVGDETKLDDVSFLSSISDSGEAVLLFEFADYIHATASTDTNAVNTWAAKLQLAVYDNETERKVASYELPVSGSDVEDMFRFKNIRRDGTGRESTLGEPANYPDDLVPGNNFVFVHGYNVSAEQGDATHAEVFKRMYQSGFNGKFWGVSWYGNVPAAAGSHYHNSVIEAFAASQDLRAFLTNSNYFPTPPDLAAHSLGNGVVGFALQDASGSHKILNHYFALDAAMPLEAYGEIENVSYMEPVSVSSGFNAFYVPPEPPYFTSSWNDYPDIAKASEWHTLFDATDHRSELTWRNRCLSTVSRVNSAYNFYSSSEEVLRADDSCTSFLISTPYPIGAGAGYYAWQVQELYKGQKWYWSGIFPNSLPDLVAGGSSEQAGWQFTLDTDSMHVTEPLSGPSIVDASVENQWMADDPVAYQTALKSDPLFEHKPEIMISTNGSDFVNGLVQDYAGDLQTDYVPTTVSSVRIRDWLLAKGFSARTRPMGSTRNSQSNWMNYNMASADALGLSGDLGLRLHGWPRNDPSTYYDGLPEWRHGDYKDVAYQYVQELYKTWVDLTK